MDSRKKEERKKDVRQAGLPPLSMKVNKAKSDALKKKMVDKPEKVDKKDYKFKK